VEIIKKKIREIILSIYTMTDYVIDRRGMCL
jgi:hypothetical protein